jgi:hypothetical protein
MFTNKSKTVYYNQKHINKHNYNIGYIWYNIFIFYAIINLLFIK